MSSSWKVVLTAALVVPWALSCAGKGSLDQGECLADGRIVVEQRCLSCHTDGLVGTARHGATAGVDFDTEEDVRRHADSIRDTALIDDAMPPPHGMALCERATLEHYLNELVEAVCLPSCEGKVCGDDGCGASCGECGSGTTCDAGACVCVPSCTGKECGPNGCGGVCGAGSCADGLFCNTLTGTCSGECTPDCGARVCGDNGCGGSCGDCGDGQGCSPQGQCVCVPSCAGKTCGDNGCGGSCGSCSTLASCELGACVWQTKSYAADVHPLFQSTGCASAQCHGASSPKAGLDLSSATVGYAELVDVASIAPTCAGRTFVVPSDVTASYLVNKLSGAGMCAGVRMPKGGSAFSLAQIDIVRAWIGSGAAP